MNGAVQEALRPSNMHLANALSVILIAGAVEGRELCGHEAPKIYDEVFWKLVDKLLGR